MNKTIQIYTEAQNGSKGTRIIGVLHFTVMVVPSIMNSYSNMSEMEPILQLSSTLKNLISNSVIFSGNPGLLNCLR